MEQNTNIPGPGALRKHLSEAEWAEARRDYEAGEPSAVVAETHGTADRTVRRRAALEGWRRRPLGRWTDADPEAPISALEFFARRRRKAADRLLVTPSADELLGFAFERVSEAAAMDRPATAAGWLRLIDGLRRNYDLVAAVVEEADESDRRRAEVMEWGRDVLDTAGDDDAAPAETDSAEEAVLAT